MSLERAETGAVVVQIEVCDATMTQDGGEPTILNRRSGSSGTEVEVLGSKRVERATTTSRNSQTMECRDPMVRIGEAGGEKRGR